MAQLRIRTHDDHGSPAAMAPVALLPGRTRNGLLDQVATGPFDRLKPHLSVGALRPYQRLWEFGRPVTRVYFPVSGMSPELRAILLRYTHAYLNSVTQSAACNRAHVLEQRLAARLLRASARAGQDQLAVTHEVIATLLGVRRAGVTVAAQSLQTAGFIRYTHGQITISDAVGLESASCECNEVIESQYGHAQR